MLKALVIAALLLAVLITVEVNWELFETRPACQVMGGKGVVSYAPCPRTGLNRWIRGE